MPLVRLAALAALTLPIPEDVSLTIPLHFEKKRGRDSHSFLPLFEYDGQGSILHEGTVHPVTLPESDADRSVAYGFVYFAGNPGVLDRTCLLVVEGYDSAEPRYLIDANNDLDLRNDPDPATFEADTGDTILTVHHPERPERWLALRVGVLGGHPNYIDDPAQLARMGALLSGVTARHGGTPLEPGLWLYEQTLNTRSASVEKDGLRFQIGLHDLDCNGIFDDEGQDLVLVGEHGAEFLPTNLSAGAAKLGEHDLIRIQGKTFEIREVDPFGTFVRIAPSDRPYTRLIDGAPLPDARLTRFDGEEADLRSFIGPEKYLLIDFWGEWCVGCVEAIPILRFVNKTFAKRVTILGVHNGDTDKARALVQEEKLPWAQVECTDSLAESFLVDRWPTYVLVDPEGRIVKLGIELTEVIQLLQE